MNGDQDLLAFQEKLQNLLEGWMFVKKSHVL